MIIDRKAVNADYLLFDAPRNECFITGSEAVAEAIRRANIDMAVAYPITPQSESMHLVGDLYAKGYVKDFYRAENEFEIGRASCRERVYI